MQNNPLQGGGAKILLPLLGVACTTWSIVTLPTFITLLPARDVTLRIIEDERFTPSALTHVRTELELLATPSVQHPAVARAKALVAVRTSEQMTSRSGTADSDGAIEAVQNLQATIEKNPCDAFSWLLLYSVATSRGGFDDENIRFLGQSYTTGPLEGWVALRRNRLALAVFSSLSDSVQQRVISEFAALVDSSFIEAAAVGLTGVGWAHRDRLLRSLVQTDIVWREALAKRLTRDGVAVKVPGVDVDQRWWR